MQVEIRGVEKLSLRERQVVALKELGWTNEEIAVQLGLSAGTVGVLYHRARKKGYQVVIVLISDPLGIATESAGEDDGQASSNANKK